MSLQSPWAKREDIPFSRTNKNTEDLNNDIPLWLQNAICQNWRSARGRGEFSNKVSDYGNLNKEFMSVRLFTVK
jgi:hypothetical protein